MMIMVKTFVKMMEEWGEDVDEFYVSYEVGIGPSEINGLQLLKKENR